MILNEKYKKPFFSFEFGTEEKTISLGEKAVMYVDTIYNNYEYDISCSSFLATKKDFNTFEIEPLSVGTYEISVQLNTARKIGSNIIKLIVI